MFTSKYIAIKHIKQHLYVSEDFFLPRKCQNLIQSRDSNQGLEMEISVHRWRQEAPWRLRINWSVQLSNGFAGFEDHFPLKIFILIFNKLPCDFCSKRNEWTIKISFQSFEFVIALKRFREMIPFHLKTAWTFQFVEIVSIKFLANLPHIRKFQQCGWVVHHFLWISKPIRGFYLCVWISYHHSLWLFIHEKCLIWASNSESQLEIMVFWAIKACN